MMLFTLRAFHMATEVHATSVKTSTHLQLVKSLEDRLRGDIARAESAAATAPTEVRLRMPDASEVVYQLTQPNLVERKTNSAAVNQRWKFAIDLSLDTQVRSVDQRQLVRVTFRHRSANDDKAATWQFLRGIEVSEVTHAR